MKKSIWGLMVLTVLLFACESDDDTQAAVVPNAGTITGGPFNFIVDGNPDMVSGIQTDPQATGTNRSWVITDDQGVILGLPPTMADLEGVDFEGAGVGVCLIWYLRFEDGLQGAEVGQNCCPFGSLFIGL